MLRIRQPFSVAAQVQVDSDRVVVADLVVVFLAEVEKVAVVPLEAAVVPLEAAVPPDLAVEVLAFLAVAARAAARDMEAPEDFADLAAR